MNTVEALDKLSEFQAQAEALNLQKQEMIDRILTPEIKAQIADIEAEFTGKASAVSENISTMQDSIKAAVLAGKASVKGTYLMAVWVKGRAGGWDGAKLDGYAAAHPEIMTFKKPDGEPTVSFRGVK